MAKIVLAVSGGVDSIVMLDLTCRSKKFRQEDLIVAHFDHGIRANSAEDANFVEQRAKEYGLDFFYGSAKLSLNASEAEAREARYDFLRNVASRTGAQEIWTAHHLDDLAESVIINLLRGTGWRGLAVFSQAGIGRPLLNMTLTYEPLDRNAILEYAGKRRLTFREDQSNSSDEYLRNRVRRRLEEKNLSLENKLQLYELWQKQKQLKIEINPAISALLPKDNSYRRSWFAKLDQNIAIEILRLATLHAGIAATRPQLEEFRQAILAYAPGKYFNLPKGRLVRLTKTHFVL